MEYDIAYIITMTEVKHKSAFLWTHKGYSMFLNNFFFYYGSVYGISLYTTFMANLVECTLHTWQPFMRVILHNSDLLHWGG